MRDETLHPLGLGLIPAASGDAPGGPGLEPRWTSSAKSGVGTALDARSRVWFTLSHGIVNEVYFPRVDQANTRDVGLIVTDDAGFFSEEKRDADAVPACVAPGVPAYRMTNACRSGRYRLTKTVVTDPERDVLLQEIRFEPLVGALADYHVHALLAPHIQNQGAENDGWVGEYKGVPMLFAQRADTALALACSAGFTDWSCGFVGVSDGWQQLRAAGRLTHRHARALRGNIALTGELALTRAAEGRGATVVLALGFGRTPTEAGEQARLSLLRPFALALEEYVGAWRAYLRRVGDEADDGGDAGAAAATARGHDMARLSLAVLKVHEDKSARGGTIASLSIPWGQARGDHDLGGYHLVWPRDLVENAGARLAAGDVDGARRTLRFLMATQEEDGHWPQNMWLDGRPYWTGVQMDETAYPIILADALRRRDALDGVEPWPMVWHAASYLVRNGPVTAQDRWEENGGYSPFTLALEIAALLAAADFADRHEEHACARYLRELADAWNECIERWTYVTDTALAHAAGVDGYYARIAPPDAADAMTPKAGYVPIKNRPPGEDGDVAYEGLVSPDALALVRFGLRAPDDERIRNTVRVLDAVLRRETPTGPIWYRYNGDSYGEHADGAPFDGTGIGRGWPLLAGERAHYELSLGNAAEARRLLGVLARQASDGGLLPEQVWDAPDIPERELFDGRPAGSAMPLVWAHAEYLKLLRSLRDGRVFDTPPQPVARYVRDRTPARVAVWFHYNRLRAMRAGQSLRIQTLDPVLVHWSADDWRTTHDVASTLTGLGVHHADIPADALPAGATVRFTLFWCAEERWEGEDYAVAVDEGGEAGGAPGNALGATEAAVRAAS